MPTRGFGIVVLMIELFLKLTLIVRHLGGVLRYTWRVVFLLHADGLPAQTSAAITAAAVPTATVAAACR